MPNIVITNNDLGNPILCNSVAVDDTLTAAGAGTILAGTILARDSVSLKLVAFVKGGTTNEDGIPKAILTYEVVADGAGDIPIRAAVSGEYNLNRLVIDADGDASNIDAEVTDALRDYSLVPQPVTELTKYDNQ